jgi:hypothetical protein
VAFEDPDGSKLKAMLMECYLYVFRTRATMKKWKHHPIIHKETTQKPTAQHTAGNESALKDDKVEVVTQLTQTPWAETNAQMSTQLFSTPSPTTSIFEQYNAHQWSSSFSFGIGLTTLQQQSSFISSFGFDLTTPCHQSLFGRSSPVTPITEPNHQQPQHQPPHNNNNNNSQKALLAAATGAPLFSTPTAPTRASGSTSPPPAPVRTRPPNPPCNAKGKKTARAT